MRVKKQEVVEVPKFQVGETVLFRKLRCCGVVKAVNSPSWGYYRLRVPFFDGFIECPERELRGVNEKVTA